MQWNEEERRDGDERKTKRIDVTNERFITTIQVKGDLLNSEIYRQITLLKSMYKILICLIFKTLKRYADKFLTV